MPQLEFQVVAVVRELDTDDRPLLLAEDLLFPEFCCLDAREPRLRVHLRDALKHEIETMPGIELHRRADPGEPVVREVSVEMTPPARSIASADPATLRFQTVRWRHGEEAWIAFVPALGIEISAPQEEQLDQLIPQHSRPSRTLTKHRNCPRSPACGRERARVGQHGQRGRCLDRWKERVCAWLEAARNFPGVAQRT